MTPVLEFSVRRSGVGLNLPQIRDRVSSLYHAKSNPNIFGALASADTASSSGVSRRRLRLGYPEG